MVQKTKLTWNQYLKMIDNLYAMIDWEKEKFDTIVSINRGGNIIATILSHRTRLPLIVIRKEQVVDVRGKILIVDEISDTGSTFLKVIADLRSGTEYRTAALHMQEHTKHTPHFCVSKTSQWVVYPYEKD